MWEKLRTILNGVFLLVIGYVIFTLFLKRNHLGIKDFSTMFGIVCIYMVWVFVAYIAMPMSKAICDTYREARSKLTKRFVNKKATPKPSNESQPLNVPKQQEVLGE